MGITSSGFGHQPFGHRPFGHEDWCYIVLYESLPEEYKTQDELNGGLYKKFVLGVCPSFNELRTLISGFDSLVDPDKIRLDLLKHLADSFGVEIDDFNPEEYQRTAVRVNARFNVIKGTARSIEVLANIYGFNLTVQESYYSESAADYTTEDPWITDEVVGTIG